MYRFIVPRYCDLCYTHMDPRRERAEHSRCIGTSRLRTTTPTGYTLYAVVVVVVLALCLCDSHRDPWIMTQVMVLGTLDGCHVLSVCVHTTPKGCVEP